MHFEIDKRIWQERLLALLLFISVAHPFGVEVPNLTLTPVPDSCDAWSGAQGHPAKHSPVQRADHANDEADRLKSGQASDSSVILTSYNNVSLYGRTRRFTHSDESLSPQTHFFRVQQGRAPPATSPAAL